MTRIDRVDRVAKALHEWACAQPKWEDCFEKTKNQWRKAAELAISAMEETK